VICKTLLIVNRRRLADEGPDMDRMPIRRSRIVDLEDVEGDGYTGTVEASLMRY
jgi:hypothetical protein